MTPLNAGTVALNALNIAISQAKTYHLLLGSEWNHNAGTAVVRRGNVRIDARYGRIRFRDLAPDDEPREDRFIELPPGISNSVVVAIAGAIYEATEREL